MTYKYSFCEIFARKLLPSIKLYIAYKLVREHGFTQLEASRILGVKQPLINYMLSGRRRPRYLKLILETPEIKKYLDEIVERISRKNEDIGKVNLTCCICDLLRSREELLHNILEKLGYKSEEVYIPYQETKR